MEQNGVFQSPRSAWPHVGLIGMGRIAQQMLPRAAAFGMPVIAWSRNLTPQRAESLGVGHRQSILDLAADADIVSVHLA